MSITSIGWNTDQIIRINKADMQLIQTTPVVIYRLDTDVFFTDLKDEERTADGMPWPDTQRNSSPVTLGGITYARVLEIIDPYTITFEDDQYVVQLIGSNNNIIEKTNANQVSVQGNNAAGLIQVDELQYSAYQNVVTVDALNGTAGQAYPIGTLQQPVSNLTDALFIAELRGFDTFSIIGDITIPTGPDFSDKKFIGQSETKTTVTVPAAATVNNCEYSDMTVTGTLDGESHIYDALIGTLNFVNGLITRCGFTDVITLGGTAQASFIDCYSLVPGTAAPEIIIGTGQALAIRNYNGGLELSGKTGTDACSVDMASGQVIIADDNTTGTITLRGVAKWTNEDTYIGTTVVNNELLTSAQLREVWKILGLDAADPVEIRPTGVDSDSGDIDINFTGDGVTLTRMARQ